MSAGQIAKDWIPPALFRTLRSARRYLRAKRPAPHAPDSQQLDLYWDPAMAHVLETWGETTTWREIQYFLSLCRGSVLDIACGTGKVMTIVSRFPDLDVHGCDISDFLLGKAAERGLPPDRLRLCDATKTGYPDNRFDYAYSIGSLEHFTEEGIGGFLQECRRITRTASFHNIPVSNSGKDQGWIEPYQAYFNNTVEWWLPKFTAAFARVEVLDSAWEDERSAGKWFVCFNADARP